MRTFILHRPDSLRQHLVDHFGLEGTVELEFSPPAAGKGSIAVGNMVVPKPWRGTYFVGATVKVTAVPEPGYCFAGWQPTDLPQTPELTVTVKESQTFTPRFHQDCAQAARPGDVTISHVQVDDDGETVEGDWFELLVTRTGGIDLRGWRLTDNDNKTATDEGSLIFSQHDALAHVPRGTTILIVATKTLSNDTQFPRDDLSTLDRRMVLYIGNGHLDADTDPWFNLAPGDNLVLLSPGPSPAFHDDIGVAFTPVGDYNHRTVTLASFGILADGVWSTANMTGAQRSLP
jgi:hypothetical protein